MGEMFQSHLCLGLPTHADETTIKTLKKDKGQLGKAIEYFMFGNKPNSTSEPDIKHLGIDIKSCAIKHLKTGGKNAKERQCMTNCGNTDDYATFQDIRDHEHFKDSKYYAKCRQFVLFVRDNDNTTLYKTYEQASLQRLVAVIMVDIESLPQEMQDTIHEDWKKIRQRVLDHTVSQTGQQYLHIHTHGSKGDHTRALGFTAKFITTIIAHHLAQRNNKPIEEVFVKKGISWYIRDEFC